MSGRAESVDLSKLNAKDRQDIERMLTLGRECLDDEGLDPRPRSEEIVKWLVHRVVRERVFLRHKRIESVAIAQAEAGWDSEIRDRLFDEESAALRAAVQYDKPLTSAVNVLDAARRLAAHLATDTANRSSIEPKQLFYLR
jgi:hypothetical protein